MVGLTVGRCFGHTAVVSTPIGLSIDRASGPEWHPRTSDSQADAQTMEGFAYLNVSGTDIPGVMVFYNADEVNNSHITFISGLVTGDTDVDWTVSDGSTARGGRFALDAAQSTTADWLHVLVRMESQVPTIYLGRTGERRDEFTTTDDSMPYSSSQASSSGFAGNNGMRVWRRTNGANQRVRGGIGTSRLGSNYLIGGLADTMRVWLDNRTNVELDALAFVDGVADTNLAHDWRLNEDAPANPYDFVDEGINDAEGVGIGWSTNRGNDSFDSWPWALVTAALADFLTGDQLFAATARLVSLAEVLEVEFGMGTLNVYNCAAIALGLPPLTAETDNTPHARILRAKYPNYRRKFLASHPWNGAKTTRALNKLAAEPVARWDAQYTLPSDYLRALTVNGFANEIDKEAKWEVEVRPDGLERILLSNETTIKLEYIRDVNVAVLSAEAQDAMGLGLALQVAAFFHKTVPQIRQLRARADAALEEARGSDGQEQSPLIRADSSLLDARL